MEGDKRGCPSVMEKVPNRHYLSKTKDALIENDSNKSGKSPSKILLE
jgi:hypothetical protein